ncbi:MAG: tRNA (adenosine(37)-N6)-threonylcarbamoyltransferase complex ATPase subunit type 1 TsaE [Syntrophobacteraceae bacterium]|nr:tRNA (adenosine(37)-N6)-threonylcarbamoyltransferase complex ATPase subunit type 1 TsaE [Syntrophobacteraceae bacterium]
MNEFDFCSPGEQCSLLLGRKIGELLEEGDILALWGELAAGKTLLTRGIARGLGVPPEERVTSPTFTIINEYSGRLTLFHLDLYRLSGADELETLPWQESLFGNGVAVIEWPGRLGRLLPDKRWDIEFSITGEESRTMLLRPHGSRNLLRMSKWLEELGALKSQSACMTEETTASDK